jgi:cytochrome c5
VRRNVALAALVALAVFAAASAAPPSGTGAASNTKWPYASTFPDGDGGAALANSRCAACHSAMLTMQQAKDSAAWEKTLTQMETWGSPPLTPGERDTLRTWLQANWGPRKR